MYAEHFGLRELPFSNTPDPRYFFATPDHEEALASLVYAVQERKGFVLLTGEIGAGKTLVSRMMLRHFQERIASAVIHHSVADGTDLLQAIATEFEIAIDSALSASAIVRRLHDFLLERYAQDMPVVLVVDEAQNLPHSGFEQLRMIGNLEADQAKLLQICFVGQPELQGIIRTPELRQLRQRIFRSFHLPPLSRDLTESYIQHRLDVAGAAGQPIFEMGALDRIFSHSRGIPRVINTVCDNAMLSAYSNGRTAVDEDVIDAVISFEIPERSPAPAEAPRSVVTPAAVPESLAHEIAQAQAQLHELRSQVGTLRVETGLSDARHRSTELSSALAASLRHAELTLRRVDRACETIAERERRVQSLGRAVDGMASLLAPMAGRFDEITSHSSAQLSRAESTAARLENLMLRTRHAVAAAGDDLTGVRPETQVVRQREAERRKVFAGLTEAVSDLRLAARQLSTGLLPPSTSASLKG